MAKRERRDPPDLLRAETIDKGHGRLETRMIAVRTRLPARLDKKWTGITAICRIERRRELKNTCTRQVIYAITSLPSEKLDAAHLLRLARDHWRIENSLFHVRDVTFGEDGSRVHTGTAPHVMAELRNATLTLIRRDGHKPRPAREAFAARPRAAIDKIMTA